MNFVQEQLKTDRTLQKRNAKINLCDRISKEIRDYLNAQLEIIS